MYGKYTLRPKMVQIEYPVKAMSFLETNQLIEGAKTYSKLVAVNVNLATWYGHQDKTSLTTYWWNTWLGIEFEVQNSTSGKNFSTIGVLN